MTPAAVESAGEFAVMVNKKHKDRNMICQSLFVEVEGAVEVVEAVAVVVVAVVAAAVVVVADVVVADAVVADEIAARSGNRNLMLTNLLGQLRRGMGDLAEEGDVAFETWVPACASTGSPVAAGHGHWQAASTDRRG